jgi:hypothetical protein
VRTLLYGIFAFCYFSCMARLASFELDAFIYILLYMRPAPNSHFDSNKFSKPSSVSPKSKLVQHHEPTICVVNALSPNHGANRNCIGRYWWELPSPCILFNRNPVQ